MKLLTRHTSGFRWEGIPVEEYKTDAAGFRGASRQVLFSDGASELRYFELAPGGYTTLERHRHLHEVMVLTGSGRALVQDRILELGPFDLVRVPPASWHQFCASADEPLGFLCLVNRERDRPVQPDARELEALRRDPAVAAFLRT